MDARREELLKRRKALLENKQKPESLKDKVLRYGIKDPAAGFGEFGNKILNIPSNVASFAGKPELAEQLGVFKNYDYGKGVGLPEEQNIADMLIRMAPEIAEGMAIPGLNLGKAGQTVSKIPKVGKYIQKILSESIPQAGLAGALSQPEDASEAALTAGATQAPFSVLSQLAMSSKPEYQKLFSTLGGIAGGALGGYGLHELGAPSYVSAPAAIALSALGSKGLGTKAMMMQEHAGGKNMPLAEERMKAAERIGLDFLTPEEAFNSPFLARKQGRLGKTDEGSELMYEKFQKRVESEQNAINAVLKEIHDPEIMGPQAKNYIKKLILNLSPQLLQKVMK